MFFILFQIYIKDQTPSTGDMAAEVIENQIEVNWPQPNQKNFVGNIELPLTFSLKVRQIKRFSNQILCVNSVILIFQFEK